MTLTANRISAIAVALLGGYLQLVEWVDLYPWNDVRNGNGQEMLDIILAAATLGLFLFLWFGGRLAACLGVVALGAWAWLQATTWWFPYVIGASEPWKRVYARWFDGTISVLPKTASHLPPDANHLVLHVLILVAFAACVRAILIRTRA